MNIVFRLLIPLLLMGLTEPSPAQDLTSTQKKMTGLEIARQIFDRHRGHNSISTATMVLISENDTKRSRSFTSTRILENGLEKQLVRFTSPADIDGTGFLTIETPGYETEQFLYLPALRRTRRIVSAQKSHRFVNSDFTYEDMERHPIENYLYDITGEKIVDGLDCHVLETRPKENIDSQYSLTKSLIAKTSYVPIFAEFFDKKGTHIKTYKVLKLEKIQDIWTESMILMEDVIKKHKTVIKLQHVEYNTDIKSEQISKTALENY